MSLHASISSRAPRRIATLLGLAFLSLASAPAHAQTPVVFGDVITDPGVYFLAGNQSGTGTGIRIDSDDVVLLLGRFTLRGTNFKAGIFSESHDNVHVWGGRVTNFNVGVSLNNGEHCSVKDTRIDHCGRIGLELVGVTDSFFSRVRCDHNGDNGVDARDVDYCRFLSILADYNEHNGILFAMPAAVPFAGVGDVDGPDSTHNKIKKCWAAYNGLDGIRLFDSDDNEVEENECVNNQLAGIRLGSALTDGSDVVNAPGSQHNFLRSNWCVFNAEGITIEWGSGSNTITNNTALANFSDDMVEKNYESPCANAWFLNFFLTKGGAGAGCVF